MRVLALATSYPKGPGDSTAPFIRSISHGLAGHGFEVHLLLPRHPDLQWEEGDPPVHLHWFRYLPRNAASLHLWGYAGALRADVALRGAVWGIAPPALAASFLRLRSLARRLRPDVIHAHWVLPNGPPAALVSRGEGIPLVLSLHGSGTFLAERGGPLAAAARYAFRSARGLTACSWDLARRAYGLGAEPGGVTVIPYGADPNAFAPPGEKERTALRDRMGIPPGAFLVLAVGRLVEKKGFRHLVEGFARAFPEAGEAERGAPAFLWIAGGGDLEAELREEGRRWGLSQRFRLLGNRDRAGVEALYRAADVLVVPSVRDSAGNVDGLPNVLLEGLASGLPVVASRVAGIPDVIRDGENGLLVPEGDARALSGALLRLASDPGLSSALGGEARRTVEGHLSWHAVSRRYGDVLRDAARRGRPGGVAG